MQRAHPSDPAAEAPTTDASAAPALTASSLYRAVWRWHFYAGLLVLPFLAWLAITGALFVYHDAIDGAVHADLLTVHTAPAHAVPRTVSSASVCWPKLSADCLSLASVTAGTDLM